MLRPIMKTTRFRNGLVMVSADCINYAGLVKTLEKLFKRKLDLCQTHRRQVPVFSRLSKYHVSGLLPLCSQQRQVTFTGPFLGVPSLQITLEIGQTHLSIEAQCDHHTTCSNVTKHT